MSSSQQTRSTLIPGHFAHGPICPPDAIGLIEEVCLVYMPHFRAWGVLGRPGQPGVKFTGKRAMLGAHTP
eukprot:1158894-Pelagomonas_calceolata.AAC.2